MRRYVFAFFAACVALAAGIALGAGPLQGAASADGPDHSDAAALRDKVTALEGAQSFGTAVTGATSDTIVADRLSGASVTVLALPGVDADTVTAMSSALTRSGATVEVTASLDARLVDPAQKSYATSVAAASMKKLADLSEAGHAKPYVQLGALIGRAYAGKGDDLVLDNEAIKIDSELQGAKLASLAEQPHRRGSLVLVLGAGEHGGDDVTQATHAIEVQLLSALTEHADAVLVATPPTGDSSGGLLTAIAAKRSTRTAISTLDVTDGPAAQIATVFALAAGSAGSTGAYGVTDNGVELPPGLEAHGG